jgi:hypothetical protein
MITTQYYRKPTKVHAFQWYGDDGFVDVVRAHCDSPSHVTIQTESGVLFAERGDLRIVQEKPLIEMTITWESGYEVIIAPGWWLIVEGEDKWAFWPDDIFKSLFFSVETETKTSFPDLKDLI